MPSGILLLDKPRGLSSNAALQRVRRLLEGAKAGHAGSLDPLATGMLPICVGEATKIAGDIVAGAKRYRFSIALGARTATADAEGAVTATAAVPALTRGAVESVLDAFLGARSQVPPMYSALKQGGAPLYRLARAGLTVERAPRAIEIYELKLLALEPRRLELETRCSKGTYVRVLAEEIAEALGTMGHVSSLRRLSVEPFGEEAMQTLESLAKICAAGGAVPLLPADYPLAHLTAVRLEAADAARLLKGQAVPASVPGAAQLVAGQTLRVRLYDEAGRFLGVGTADRAGYVQPRRLLNAANSVAASGRPAGPPA
ncbi:MAG TPA: tRNA pseudouridine(55) synthase TruB [Steroidobacteraceae bacterium]|nr:tRNA pseudouridine(55) synthase TruB [Steroidobacteraceae bacterium]